MAKKEPLNSKDTGLLILRIGIGVMFMLHGLPKITGGTEQWAQMGRRCLWSASGSGIHSGD